MGDPKTPPRKGSSGEHAAVKAFRAKLESISEHTMPLLQDLNASLDEQLKSERRRESTPPSLAARDPRRDGDSDPPVDVVEEKKT